MVQPNASYALSKKQFT